MEGKREIYPFGPSSADIIFQIQLFPTSLSPNFHFNVLNHKEKEFLFEQKYLYQDDGSS